jgi:hypothetical protein
MVFNYPPFACLLGNQVDFAAPMFEFPMITGKPLHGQLIQEKAEGRTPAD